MAEYQLTLPDRKPGIAALTRLNEELRESFTEELLDTLWTAHEAGHLSDDVTMVLRDWLARASFDASPEFHERLAKAHNGSAPI